MFLFYFFATDYFFVFFFKLQNFLSQKFLKIRNNLIDLQKLIKIFDSSNIEETEQFEVEKKILK